MKYGRLILAQERCWVGRKYWHGQRLRVDTVSCVNQLQAASTRRLDGDAASQSKRLFFEQVDKVRLIAWDNKQ